MVKQKPARRLADLDNVGPATLKDFALLGIESLDDLATSEALVLYRRLCEVTKSRQDPCVYDVFAATIHEAKTGEARKWWTFTPARQGDHPDL